MTIMIGGIEMTVEVSTGELGYDLVSITPASLSPILTGLITVRMPDEYGAIYYGTDTYTV